MSVRFTASVLALVAVVMLAPRIMQAEAAPPLIPRRALFAEPDRPAMQLAPDGTKLAMVEVHQQKRTVRILPLDRDDDTHTVDLVARHDPLNLWWSPSGKRLLILAASGNSQHLLSHDLATGKTTALTTGSGVRARLERMAGDGNDAALIAVNDRDPETFDVDRVDLATGQRQRILTATDFRRIHADAALRPRIAERSADGGAIELLRRADDGAWQPLRTLALDETNTRAMLGGGIKGALGVNESGDTLYLIDNDQRDKSALFAIDIANGASKLLIEDADADLRPLAVIDRRDGAVLGCTSYFGDLRRHALSPQIQEELLHIERVLGSTFGVVSISLADSAWLLTPLDGGPIRFHVYDRRTKQLRAMPLMYDSLVGQPLVRRKAALIPARDGLRLPCQVYLPPGTDDDGDGRPAEPLPTILYVHGGPTIPAPWDGWNTNRNLQLLANRGYAVLNVDFRGAGGYGRAHLERGWRQWGGDIQRDIVDAARWAVEQRIAREGKVGIFGWSFGGLSTHCALAFTPDVFACGVSMYGLSDLELFCKYAGFGPGREAVARTIGDAWSDEGRRLLAAQSPLTAVDRITAPLLITHGAKDRVTPKVHSDRLVAAMQQKGKHVTYLEFPDEGHDYENPESWIAFWAVAERFLHEHLGGRYEPFGEDLHRAKFTVAAGADRVPELKDKLPG